MAMLSEATRNATRALGFAALLSLVFPPLGLAQEGEWKGMPRLETMDPRMERRDPLRAVRVGEQFERTLEDQKSILGWGNAARTGTLESRDKPGTTESLEIMRRGEIQAKSREAEAE